MKMKRLLSVLMACMLLALFFSVPAAYAGEETLTVQAPGKGVEVYPSYTARKSSGILYNGYMSTAYPTYKNNRIGFSLTGEYKAYLVFEQAEELIPEIYNPYGGESYRDIYMSMLCNAFEAEVCVKETQVYLTPDGKATSMTCYQGTRTVVWGEFGGRYFVDDYGITGFIDKKHLSRIGDLSFWDAQKAPYEDGYEERFEEKTIITDGGHIHIGEGYFLENGDKVRVRAYTGNGLAQLLEEGLIEARFLDPDGDHSTNNVYAVVKTDSPLDRLRVKSIYINDCDQKLCSGVRVEVLETKGENALISLKGTNQSERVTGTVPKKYLAFGEDGEKVKNGCTRVALTEDYADYWGENANPAGTVLTVVGCEVAYTAGDADRLIVMTEDGELFVLYDENGIMQPVDPAGYQAKTTTELIFREKPNKNGKKIRSLPKGAIVEVLLRGECWTMIRYKKTTGYVMSRYLKFMD